MPTLAKSVYLTAHDAVVVNLLLKYVPMKCRSFIFCFLVLFLNSQGASLPVERALVVDAHRPVSFCLEVTNTMQRSQTIGMVKTSCACLEVPLAVGRTIPAGQSILVETRFDPHGLSGHIAKTVAVQLEPSGIKTIFPIEADVRVRCGLSPCEVFFGVGGGSSSRMHVCLSGYAVKSNSAFRVTGVMPPENHVFDVTVDPDGRGVVVSFSKVFESQGMFMETWRVRTNDQEVPELVLPISACVPLGVDVIPPQIVVDCEDLIDTRSVILRSRPGVRSPSLVTAITQPRPWGNVVVSRCALGGWRIDVSEIDVAALRQFSRHPYLEVKTDVHGAEMIKIPIRVMGRKDGK